MSEFSEKMGIEVGNAFKSGYNCSQSVVLAFADMYGFTQEQAARMAASFGGGIGRMRIGHARNICGALVGCTMVISTLIGRNTPEEKPLKEIYPVTKEFHDRFEKEFGSTMCKDLMPYEFNTRDHLKNCLKLTNRIGKFLAEFLEEKGLLTV